MGLWMFSVDFHILPLTFFDYRNLNGDFSTQFGMLRDSWKSDSFHPWVLHWHIICLLPFSRCLTGSKTFLPTRPSQTGAFITTALEASALVLWHRLILFIHIFFAHEIFSMALKPSVSNVANQTTQQLDNDETKFSPGDNSRNFLSLFLSLY